MLYGFCCICPKFRGISLSPFQCHCSSPSKLSPLSVSLDLVFLCTVRCAVLRGQPGAVCSMIIPSAWLKAAFKLILGVGPHTFIHCCLCTELLALPYNPASSGAQPWRGPRWEAEPAPHLGSKSPPLELDPRVALRPSCPTWGGGQRGGLSDGAVNGGLCQK